MAPANSEVGGMPEDCQSGVDAAATSLGALGRPTAAVAEAEEVKK